MTHSNHVEVVKLIKCKYIVTNNMSPDISGCFHCIYGFLSHFVCVYSGFLRGSDGVGETSRAAADPFIGRRGRRRASLFPQLPSLPHPQHTRALVLFLNLSLRSHHLPTDCMGKQTHSYYSLIFCSLFLIHALSPFFPVIIMILFQSFLHS